MKLEEKIKLIREKEDLSQEAFAESLGVSRQTVINWEKGKSTPTFELLKLISEKFQLEINSLIQDDWDLNRLPIEEPAGNRITIDLKKEPLYIAKKSLFDSDSKYFLILFLTFSILLAFFIFLILDLNFKDALLVFIIFIIACIVFFVIDLLLIKQFILFIKNNRKSMIYFYEDHLVIIDGTEKEFTAKRLEYYHKVRVKQTLFGKIFNYGTISIYSKPSNIKFIDNYKNPYKIKQFIEKTYPCKEDYTI